MNRTPLQDRLRRLRACGSVRRVAIAVKLAATGIPVNREYADAHLRFAAWGLRFIDETSPAPRAPISPIPAPRLSAHAFAFLLRWYLRELVNALLRPVFVAWRRAEREGRALRAEVLHLRFLTLLNSADCFPFCVRVDPYGLWIMTGDEAEEYQEDEYAA